MSAKEKIKVIFDKAKSVFFKGDIHEAAKMAGWSDHPGDGLAIMLPDEKGMAAYEVINPMQFATPIGFEPTPPIEELIRDRVRAEVNRLKGEDVVDTLEEMDDFDEPDETPEIQTMYEMIAMEEEAPAVKKQEVSRAEKAKLDAEYVDMVEQERLLRRRHREQSLKKQREQLEAEEALYSAANENRRNDATDRGSGGTGD